MAKKRPNLAKNWHFWPNIGIFGLFDPMADQTMMQTSCLGVFSVMWVPKLLHTPIKIRIFGQKKGQIWQKTDIVGQISAFLDHLVSWPTKKMMRTRCQGGFSVIRVPKSLLNPVKIRIFGPKTAKIGPKNVFLVILGQILPFFAHCAQGPTKKQCEQGA